MRTSICGHCRPGESVFQAPLGIGLELEAFFRDMRTCSSCSLLMSAILHFASRLLLKDSHPNRCWYIKHRGPQTLDLTYVDRPDQMAEQSDVRGLPIFFYLEPGSKPFQDLPVISRICDNTGSPAASKKAADWLETCCLKHESCPDARGPVSLPKRTVYIADDHEVRLSLNDTDSTGVYACLSHCWGSQAHSVLTTRENLAAHQEGIVWSRLSRTFQDAMLFALHLGIRHVWIDSLCIIQGDVEDWAEHAFQMANIFSNAHITLAATASEDGSGGCFRANHQHAWHYYRIPQKAWQVGFDPGVGDDYIQSWPLLNARVSLHTHFHPLVERGWVFQEQILSSRVLYFNDHELAWSCGHHPTGICECKQPGLFRRGDMEGAYLDEWVEIVQRFTRRELTYPSDRLPAMSGIAQEFALRRKQEDGRVLRLSNWVHDDSKSKYVVERETVPLGRYLAGLWEGRINRHLIWYNDTTRLGYAAPRRTRPSTYTGPTWSWVSVEDRVNLNWYSCRDGDDMWQVLGVECLPRSERNIYGQVTSGVLELKIRLVEICVRVDRGGHMGNVRWYVSAPSDGSVSVSNLSWDVREIFQEAENSATGVRVFCALLDQPSKFSYDGVTALVLRKRSSSQLDEIYERVGITRVKITNGKLHETDELDEPNEECPYLSLAPSIISIV